MTTRFSSSAESGNELDVYTFLTWHDRLEDRKDDSSVAAANSAGCSTATLRAPSEGGDTSVTTMFAVAPRGRPQTFDGGSPREPGTYRAAGEPSGDDPDQRGQEVDR